MTVISNPLLLKKKATGDESYQIKNSLRFNTAGTTYLRKQYSTTGDPRRWTLSYWTKRSKLGTYQWSVVQHQSGQAELLIGFRNDDTFGVQINTTGHGRKTTRVFRDTNAWYNFTIICNTSAPMIKERLKIYCNGERIDDTDGDGSVVSQNEVLPFNQLQKFDIGSYKSGNTYNDGYITDVQFIDGFVLSPAAFGEFDSNTGVWNPRAFSLPTPNTDAESPTWSNSYDSNDSTPQNGANAFDGYEHTHTQAASTQNCGWNPPATITAKCEIRLLMEIAGSGGGTTAKCNGRERWGDWVAALGRNSKGWWTVPERKLIANPGGGWNDAINFANNGNDNVKIYAIEVDGVVLEDGRTDLTAITNLNDGKTWSTGGSWYQGTAADAFNGNLSDGPVFDTNWRTITDHDIVVGNRIKIKTNTGSQTETLKDADGNEYALQTETNEVFRTVWNANSQSGTPYTGTLKGPVQITRSIGSSHCYAIEVDGHILINSTVDNSFHLKFDDRTEQKYLGYSQVMNTCTGAQPMYGPGAIDSAKSDLVLALPGYDLNDHHHTIKGSGSAKTITANGNTTTSATRTKFYDKAIYFDGNGDYLTTGSNTDFATGTGAFTYELWVYWIDESTNASLGGTRGSGNDANGWSIAIIPGSGNRIQMWTDDANNLTTGGITPLMWTHFACVRDGSNNMKFYINGKQESSDTVNNNFTTSGTGLTLGDDAGSGANEFKGYVQDVRFYKGTAKYTSEFTPPTRSDFQTINGITETVTATTESTYWNNAKTIHALGGATTDTDQSKWYGSSAKLTADAEYLITSANSDYDFGTGDYTAECWVYFTADNDEYALSSSTEEGIHWGINNYGGMVRAGRCHSGGVFEHQVSSTLSTNTWHHIAISKDTNGNRLYVDGVLKNTNSSTNYDTKLIGALHMGDYREEGGNIAGNIYLSDVRIYKGVAKYTSAFTPGTNGAMPILNTTDSNHGTVASGYRTDSNASKIVLALPLNGGDGGTTFSDVSENLRSAVTQGRDLDFLPDTPTNYGNDGGNGGDVRGNYCTLNYLGHKNTLGGGTLSQGNLELLTPTDCSGLHVGSIGVSSGKWYFEVECTGFTTDGGATEPHPIIGWAGPGWEAAGAGNLGYGAKSYAYKGSNGNKVNNSETGSAYGLPWNAVGATVGCAFDADNGAIWFHKEGTWQASATKAEIAAGTTTNAAFSSIDMNEIYFPAGSCYNTANSTKMSFNFGQRAWKYADSVPSGFKALCTQNLTDTFSGEDEGVVNNPNNFFDIQTWTGVTDVAQTLKTPFSPDMVWYKEKSTSGSSHAIVDRLRGGTDAAKIIYPNTTAAEVTGTSTTSITSLNSDGWTNGSSDNSINEGTQTYVGYSWDCGSSAPGANNSGSINISAGNQWVNQTAGFSMTRYTGSGADATFGHGLGAQPKFMIFKQTNAVNSWPVQHVGAGLGQGRQDLSGQATNSTSYADAYWNSTAPTNTLIHLGDDTSVNDLNDTFMCYAWTDIPGYSAFGKYDANGDDDGPFIWTGFRPAFLIIKALNVTGENWYIFSDGLQNPNMNERSWRMETNTNGASTTYAGNKHDMLSNGFKLRENYSETNKNTAGTQYCYSAWAKHPFKIGRAH